MVKVYKVKITRQAKDNLRSIHKYISEDLYAPDAAKNVLSLLKEEIKSLSTMPERIKLIEDKRWRSEGIRKMLVRNFFVYFWIDEEKDIVQVIGVVYVARNQTVQLDLMKLQ